MNSELDEVERLRAELARLTERVYALETRLDPVATRTRSGTQFGLTAINRIGAVTVAIGIIFFFKYAVDENLIGAGAGVWLGVLFGAALVGAGDWLARRGQSVFAQGISGCGLATLYISLYASFAFYHLILRGFGFFALVLVCAAALALSVRFSSAAIATLGIAGALITPLLLHSRQSENWLDCLYLVIVAGTAVAMAIRRNWPSLAVISPALSLIAALAFFDSAKWLFVAFATGLGMLQAAGVMRAPSRSKVRTSLYVMLHVALLAAGSRGLTLAIGDRNVAYQMASVLLACWAIGALSWGLAKDSVIDVRLGVVLLGLVIAKLYVWDVWSLDKVYRITAFLALGGLLLLASWIYSRRRA